ncbi:serine/threonine-protein kinase [Natronospira bacteriovora]|uniref:Serine/threonine-protein kinase n=1 Tax=Natronospira bacteriovora TaxID=3069753 RepID=A0ABU0W7W1_9GAMM|nr:serine/threonine-protein kinase [Natronospira sp. AB-CW4]MDQ2069105.1 serine/threonine-protein kinase [Natronospira sp. AB-CW4]
MIVIDDILEDLRKETLGLDDALTAIRQRLAEDGGDGDVARLYDRVDQSQQAGLPSPQARAIRKLLDEQTSQASVDEPAGESSGDDMFELSLEPVDEPEKPETGTDITDGPPLEADDTGEGEDDETGHETLEHAAEQATEIDEPSTDDDTLPPIRPTSAGEKAIQEHLTPAGQDRDDNPPEADDRVPTADADDAPDDHEVVMETRGSIPSSSENYGETLSERAVTTTTIIGALLGGRFELLTRISQDPYGTVYRARDHEQDEANPEAQLCGVRVLPSALARQEAITKRVEAVVKRVARLRHPGILTPVALHRDIDQAWIVTKLPVGSTLARFIRRECVKGLPADRALKIVRRIGEALAVAHERRIPHGDLKPSSIFIDDKDNVRIADFGLRTALYGNKITASQAGSTELEQMDPIEAYLSLEIMEGSPPEPADDIYALGCIAAALLTGGHPFNGKSGLRRMENDLAVPRVRSLTRHQNQILRQALEVHRGDRPDAVEAFLTALETRRGKTSKMPYAVAGAVLAIIAAAWIPTQTFLENRERQLTLTELRDAGWPGIRGSIRNLAPDEREWVLESLSGELPAQYARHVEYALEDGDPLEAESLLMEALRWYPAHPRLRELDARVEQARERMVADLSGQLRGRLEAGELERGQAIPDVIALFRDLERIEPRHELANLESLRPYYRNAVEQAAAEADPDRADGLQAAADELFPDDDPIHGLINDALTRAENQAASLAAERLAPPLAERLPVNSLADVRLIEEDWRALLRMTGGHELLDEHQASVAEIIVDGVNRRADDGRWAAANELLREMAPLLPTRQLEALRLQLTRAQLADDYRPESLRTERQGLDERRGRVEYLIEHPRMTPVWGGELIIAWRDMMGWMRPGRNWLPGLREQIEELYLNAINEKLDEGDEAAALRLTRQGRAILPESRRLQAQAAGE